MPPRQPSRPPELRAQLQAALGSAYLVERELGGAGMSRVFVAEDVRLGRRVVVKVLHPELAAGVSAARFEREIRLAARLQHPHVVPVHSAGEVNGIPYYVMPYVEGESLRTRLARKGALSILDSVLLIRELASALSYAHEQGVVHRDLKPENVLLSRRHAVVADFGVARAIASAAPNANPTVAADAGVMPTPVTLGFAVGTPAYMAPEQIAGDPMADHRTDLYALGLVAYELLAGAHPFAGRTPQAFMAAHLTETPVPLEERRPETPPALAALVMRCLAKLPAERPQSAAEVLQALSELSEASVAQGGIQVTPVEPRAADGPARRRPPGRRALAAAVGFVALAVVGAAAWTLAWGGADEETAAPDVLLVADFENRVGDSSLVRTVTEALRIDLARSPRLALPGAQQVREGMLAMRADTARGLTADVARDLLRRIGGKAVLDGAVSSAGTGFVLTVRLVAVDDGRTVNSFRETASDSSDVVDAIDRLSRAVRREVGESLRSLRASERLPLATTGSLAALTAYTKAIEASRVSDWLRVADHARQAVAIDPEFGEAYRQLASALNNLGINRDESVRAATRAYELRDRLQPFERGLVEASYYSNALGDHRRAAERYRMLSAEFPGARSASARNNLANALANLGEWEQALPIARSLLDLEPRSVRYRANYIAYLTASGRLAAADSALRALARDDPRQPNVVRRAASLEKARRNYARVAELADSAMRADPEMSATGRVYLGNSVRAAAAALGRLEWRRRADGELLHHYERLGASPEQLAIGVELARLEASLGRERVARRLLDSALARHPLAAMPPLDRPYAAIAAAWAAAGDVNRAEALLRDWERAVPAENRGLDAVPVLQARIATELAAGRAAAAERLAREGGFGPCSACADLYLARAFEGRGLRDSTVAAYGRYLEARAARDLIDDTELARAYRRLGELHEESGETADAVKRYRDFVELWSLADEELQPTVAEVRRRIARLDGRTVAARP